MTISPATDQAQWDTFLNTQPFSPFLQSWTMGEVYRATGQEPIRLLLEQGDTLLGICQAIVVPARRGRHLSVGYGPVLHTAGALNDVIDHLKTVATEHHCSFIRLSPFYPLHSREADALQALKQTSRTPLHMLAEHIWYLPLCEPHPWNQSQQSLAAAGVQPRTEADILAGMRKTTRNLIRRAQKEGVTVTASADPLADLPQFLKLHEETRQRHRFTPYTDAFFRAQVEHFAQQDACTLYLAHYQDRVIAASIHMHMGGETSYHHGASTAAFAKIPASYLLQWTAITDALKRGDHTYNFWGIAPTDAKRHPFAGVTTFKRGFGGQLLELVPCQDVPVSPKYYLTRAFEVGRKWKRGF